MRKLRQRVLKFIFDFGVDFVDERLAETFEIFDNFFDRLDCLGEVQFFVDDIMVQEALDQFLAVSRQKGKRIRTGIAHREDSEQHVCQK